LSHEKKGKWGVCCYADEREVADGDEGGQHGAEDDGGVDRFLPVVGTFEAHDELEQTIHKLLSMFIMYIFLEFSHFFLCLFASSYPAKIDRLSAIIYISGSQPFSVRVPPNSN